MLPDTSINIYDVTHSEYSMEQSSNNKPFMLTINSTAERVGLSAYIIRKWALNGTIKAIRAGNKIFINNDDLDNYLNGHTLNDNVEEQESIFKPIPVK